jgi:hypothetical protein
MDQRPAAAATPLRRMSNEACEYSGERFKKRCRSGATGGSQCFDKSELSTHHPKTMPSEWQKF